MPRWTVIVRETPESDPRAFGPYTKLAADLHADQFIRDGAVYVAVLFLETHQESSC